MGKKRDTKRLRGARRMREFGYKLVAVWFDAAEIEVVEAAAKAAEKPVSTYVRETVFALSAASLQGLPHPSQ